jgi:hypothetical protein
VNGATGGAGAVQSPSRSGGSAHGGPQRRRAPRLLIGVVSCTWSTHGDRGASPGRVAYGDAPASSPRPSPGSPRGQRGSEEYWACAAAGAASARSSWTHAMTSCGSPRATSATTASPTTCALGQPRQPVPSAAAPTYTPGGLAAARGWTQAASPTSPATGARTWWPPPHALDFFGGTGLAVVPPPCHQRYHLAARRRRPRRRPGKTTCLRPARLAPGDSTTYVASARSAPPLPPGDYRRDREAGARALRHRAAPDVGGRRLRPGSSDGDV